MNYDKLERLGALFLELSQRKTYFEVKFNGKWNIIQNIPNMESDLSLWRVKKKKWEPSEKNARSILDIANLSDKEVANKFGLVRRNDKEASDLLSAIIKYAKFEQFAIEYDCLADKLDTEYYVIRFDEEGKAVWFHYNVNALDYEDLIGVKLTEEGAKFVKESINSGYLNL